MPNMKRATIWGLILFWIIFVIATVIQIIVPGDIIIGIVVMPFVIFFYSKFVYFRKGDTEVTMKEGFLVGLYWSIISIICDIIFVVYLLGIGWVSSQAGRFMFIIFKLLFLPFLVHLPRKSRKKDL